MLELSDVTVSRGGLRILENLSLTLSAGDVGLVTGPNGIGKSTLLRTIAGLQPPASGTIVVPEDGAAFVGHANGLKGPMTVTENLRFWAGVYGAPSIDAALEAFDLQTLRNRTILALSAGQKRRAGLARLVLSGCPLWVLDEPTTSLDARATQLIENAIREHQNTGGAAIIATHVSMDFECRTFDLSAFRRSRFDAEGF